ncbi:MAG TPA: threonine--tRNA ligase, partial [Acidimicrobiaceae bacterium]|nr:threonine--tRNA ligase [Acidimicrobiaceae bacterium]
LQRIYGTAWADKKALKTHLQMLAEAEKRDHRRLAAELDLVSWPDELGPGLAVWHPKGALIRKIMEDYSRDRHENGGYEFVFSPHIAKSVLWETSGHLDF